MLSFKKQYTRQHISITWFKVLTIPLQVHRNYLILPIIPWSFNHNELLYVIDHSDTNVSSHSSDTIHATSQSDAHSAHSAHSAHHRSIRSSSGNDCLNSNLMSSIVENAGPFLFPCAIEYSLICAAIMYEIWKDDHDHHANHQHGKKVDSTPGTPSSGSLRRSPHHYSVDCTNANKGLFFGIFVLVFTIISMIFFVVLINRKDYKEVAVTEVILSELILYLTTFTAVLIGMIQVKHSIINYGK